MLTTDLEPCCWWANWVMGFCLFYLFWGVVQCEVKMLWNCCDFEEGCPVGSWKENKILLFLKAYLIYKFIMSVCDGARCWSWLGPARHSRTRGFQPTGPARHGIVTELSVQPDSRISGPISDSRISTYWAQLGTAQHCDGARRSRWPGPARHCRISTERARRGGALIGSSLQGK